MRSNRLRLAAVLAAGGLLAAGCSDDGGTADGPTTTSAGDSTSTTAADAPDLSLVADGKLTVCSDIPYTPFEFEDEDGDGYTGFDVAIVDGIAERLDLETEYRVTPFDGILGSLAAGDCDLVASAMSITAERAEQVDFSAPYFDAKQSILVRAEDADTYATLEDLAGKRIGVQSGTTGETYAQENTPEGAELVGYETGDEMFPALISEDIDAVLQDFPVNGYRAQQDESFVVTATFEGAEKDQYGFAVTKENDALLEAIDEQLAALREDGTYDEIFETWFGTG